MTFLDYNFRRYNFRLLLYMIVLSVIGLMAIYSATNQNQATVNKQLMGIGVGLAIALVLSLIDYHWILSFHILIYLACVAFLAAVILFGRSRGISTRWLQLPVIGQIQPSEFVKIGIILFFSWYFERYREKMNRIAVVFAAAALFAVPAVLIYKQPNLSTLIVMTIVVAAIVFSAGISYRWILGVLAVAIPAVFLLFYLLQKGMIPFLEQYQANRILSWQNPELYSETYYQQENSIMAIGSGQLWGKGWNNTGILSVKAGNFLVEEQNDFIFAIIGEEFGFVGSLVVIGLYLILVYECLLMAMRASDLSGRMICVGMATLLGFQSFANIAVATAIFPNTGLPLPFISSGVSSLLSLFIGMGIVLNVGLQRKYNNE